jgi:hypothetical protein
MNPQWLAAAGAALRLLARIATKASLAPLLLVCACYQPLAGRGKILLENMPAPEALSICHGFGCSRKTHVELNAADIARITTLFEPVPQNAAQERAIVALAIGEFERIVGAKTGTSTDRPRAAMFDNDPSQLDCVDEALNTTLYLTLLNALKLLRFHVPDLPAHRGDGITAWLHNTGVLRETVSGSLYAIDSWFGANGDPAYVVPVEEWKEGWQPEPQS